MYHAFLFLLSIRRRPHSRRREEEREEQEKEEGGKGKRMMDGMILPKDTSPVFFLLARLSDVRFAEFMPPTKLKHRMMRSS